MSGNDVALDPEYRQRLRKGLRARGLTQAEAARSLGISQKHLSFVLTGRAGLSRGLESRLVLLISEGIPDPTPATGEAPALAAAIRSLAAAVAADRHTAPLEPEVMFVRHLGIAELGRFVVVGGFVSTDGKAGKQPEAVGGRLVGFLPIVVTNAAGNKRTTPVQPLLLQTGAQVLKYDYALDVPVSVAPREWS